MKSKMLLVFYFLLFTTLIANAANKNQIKTGMKSEDIIKILGNPFKIIKEDSLEYQCYLWNVNNELKYVLIKNNISESELLNLEDMIKGILSLAGLKDVFTENLSLNNVENKSENKTTSKTENNDKNKLLSELKDKIKINVLECKTYDSYLSGKTAGFRLKLENLSDKPIKYLKIVVYFYNKQGKIFYEERFNPVNSESWTDPFILKPNYILKYPDEDDNFMSAKGVDFESWDEGKIKIEITDIEVE